MLSVPLVQLEIYLFQKANFYYFDIRMIPFITSAAMEKVRDLAEALGIPWKDSYVWWVGLFEEEESFK